MHYDNNTLEKSTTEVIVSIDKYVISDYKPVWTSYRMRFRLVTMIAAALMVSVHILKSSMLNNYDLGKHKSLEPPLVFMLEIII